MNYVKCGLLLDKQGWFKIDSVSLIPVNDPTCYGLMLVTPLKTIYGTVLPPKRRLVSIQNV